MVYAVLWKQICEVWAQWLGYTDNALSSLLWTSPIQILVEISINSRVSMILPHSTLGNATTAPQNKPRPFLTVFFPINHLLKSYGATVQCHLHLHHNVFVGLVARSCHKVTLQNKLENIWSQNIQTDWRADDPVSHGTTHLTLILLTWTIWRAPTNASKWRMGFNPYPANVDNMASSYQC